MLTKKAVFRNPHLPHRIENLSDGPTEEKNDAPAFHAEIHSVKNGDILYSRAMPLSANGTRPVNYWC